MYHDATMEQQIRFCTSADGTRIAYATYGERTARALVLVYAFDVAQELAWKHPQARALYEGLGAGRWLVAYDRRGTGSSQRDVDDLAVPGQVADLAAVVDRLELERVDLMGVADGGAISASYAVQHPDRVRRLVLWQPHVRTSDTALRGERNLARSIRIDWSLARRGLATLVYPGSAELQRWYSNTLRESLTPEIAARYFELIAEFDVSALLPNVQAPTLVLANAGAQDVPTASVRAVASLIPDARFVILEGGWASLVLDPSPCVAAVRSFLDEADAGSQAVQPQPASGLVTILFTDVESSTALRQRLGDAKAQELVRVHDRIVREALSANGGYEIKHTGDGIMASFGSASGALACAVAIQRGVALRQAQGGQAEPVEAALGVYIGLNAGEPIAEEDPDGRVDLFGTSVDLAARICDHAGVGEILVSDVVRQLAAGKEFLFSDRDAVELRGFEDPVRLYEVRWRVEDSLGREDG